MANRLPGKGEVETVRVLLMGRPIQSKLVILETNRHGDP